MLTKHREVLSSVGFSTVLQRTPTRLHARPALTPKAGVVVKPGERRPGAEGFAGYKSLAPARNGMWRAGADYDWSPFPQEIG